MYKSFLFFVWQKSRILNLKCNFWYKPGVAPLASVLRGCTTCTYKRGEKKLIARISLCLSDLSSLEVRLCRCEKNTPVIPCPLRLCRRLDRLYVYPLPPSHDLCRSFVFLLAARFNPPKYELSLTSGVIPRSRDYF